MKTKTLKMILAAIDWAEKTLMTLSEVQSGAERKDTLKNIQELKKARDETRAELKRCETTGTDDGGLFMLAHDLSHWRANSVSRVGELNAAVEVLGVHLLNDEQHDLIAQEIQHCEQVSNAITGILVKRGFEDASEHEDLPF